MYFCWCHLSFSPYLGDLFLLFKIVSSILRVPSSGGRYKAFLTCGSHLAFVYLFYQIGLGIYLSSAISQSPRKNCGLGGIHCGHPHAELLHLQPEEPR